MKKIFLSIIIISTFIHAQFPDANKGNLTGGFGLSFIDGTAFYAFRFTPEVSFSKIGVGLDLNLEFDSKGKMRAENFNETSDYLAIIRYIRYGQKHDPIFAKVGAIDAYTLGHGSIMYAYNNSTSFDSRKIGLALDLDFTKFGFESIYSDFSQSGIIGIRGYARPLHFTKFSSIPVIGNIEVGASVVTDMNNRSSVLSGNYDFATEKFTSLQEENSLTIVGFDLGLPLLKTSSFNSMLYFDYAKIMDFGSGSSAGLLVGFSGLGLLSADIKLERRWNSDKFIPSYFNTLYEIERFNLNKSTGQFTSKAKILALQLNEDNGYYGELGVSLLNTLKIIGSYQRLDLDPKSGIFHADADISPENGSFVARAGYDKVNIEDEKDLFTLDNRSYLFAELGYKPYSYLLVSMVYNWTFTPVRNSSDEIVSYEPQKKIEPRVSFIYPFSTGGGK